MEHEKSQAGGTVSWKQREKSYYAGKYDRVDANVTQIEPETFVAHTAKPKKQKYYKNCCEAVHIVPEILWNNEKC